MSNLNLENIVGFKAVDKDGNEQNVTVDEMVDMVSTRMVMALSETSTFAAAAATGNDVYENELPTVTDAANVRVLQSSGDAAQMTMQSLATKLGGLIGVSDLSIKQVSLNRGSTVQLPITKRGLLIYGVSNTFNGAMSVVLNQKSKKELSFIGNDNTGFLSLSKDSNTGNINITYKNNDYDVTLYYRFIAIE